MTSETLSNPVETALLKRICRICLNEVIGMTPLFVGDVMHMLESFSDIKIVQNDSLPDKICKQCLSQCSKAYTFKKLCEKADQVFRNHINSIGGSIFKTSGNPVVFSQNVPQKMTVENNGPNNEECIEHIKTNELVHPCVDTEHKPNGVADETSHLKRNKINHQYCCSTCLKIFSKQSQLTRHRKIHGERHFKCVECSFSSAYKSNLSKHMCKHTGELRNQTYKSHLCNVCGLTFKYRTSLIKHSKLHTGRNLYLCNICGKKFLERNSLRVHCFKHNGEHPFKCQHCNKSFAKKFSYETHLRVHTRAKPYKCDVCAKSFMQSTYLKIHKRVHTDEKAFSCRDCGQAFTTHSSLKRHIASKSCKRKIVEIEEPFHVENVQFEKPVHQYNCFICDVKFLNVAAVTHHINVDHAPVLRVLANTSDNDMIHF